MLLLSTMVYSEVALECLQSGKSGNFVAQISNLTKKFLSVSVLNSLFRIFLRLLVSRWREVYSFWDILEQGRYRKTSILVLAFLKYQ